MAAYTVTKGETIYVTLNYSGKKRLWNYVEDGRPGEGTPVYRDLIGSIL